MMFIEQVRQGLDIVGSDGVHVGTVTRCPERSSSSRSQTRHPEARTTISTSG